MLRSVAFSSSSMNTPRFTPPTTQLEVTSPPTAQTQRSGGTLAKSGFNPLFGMVSNAARSVTTPLGWTGHTEEREVISWARYLLKYHGRFQEMVSIPNFNPLQSREGLKYLEINSLFKRDADPRITDQSASPLLRRLYIQVQALFK
jgi:hypothetical protein